MQVAVEHYKLTHGEYPPNPNSRKIFAHVLRTYGRGPRPFSFPQLDKQDIATLDENESLVFWLSGEPDRLFHRRSIRSLFFEFELTRLVDLDGDGWLEYTGRDGSLFSYSDGDVRVMCQLTNRLISAEYLESKRRR